MNEIFFRAFLGELEKLGYKGGNGPKFKDLKKNRVPLTPEERRQVMEAKAVWHFHLGRDGKKKTTPAVGKSVIKGKTWYETHTHRAYNVCPSLKGAIGRYHKFIKSTA